MLGDLVVGNDERGSGSGVGVEEIVPLAANVFHMSRSHNEHLPVLSLCITITLKLT